MRLESLLRNPGALYDRWAEKIEQALLRVLPIPSGHKKDLAPAVQELSELLTQERGGIVKSYWASPRLVAAYWHYFLPWNLQRMAWLLPQLSLPFSSGNRILDLGSGPLTFVTALWFARQELRSVPLEFTCADIAGRPLELGRALFYELAGESSPWSIRLHRGSAESALSAKHGLFHAVTGANVLNELKPAKGTTFSERLDTLLERIYAVLHDQGRILFIEPGTRLGGKCIATMRQSALERGCRILAPCLHENPCPAIDQRVYAPFAVPYKGWCHFVCPASAATPFLAVLTQQAGLHKETLTLSCLMVQRQANTNQAQLDDLEAMLLGEESEEALDVTPLNAIAPPQCNRPFPVRIISHPIKIEEGASYARYACSAHGLCLVLDAKRLPFGAACQVTVRETGGRLTRDAKSSALIVDQILRPTGGSRGTPGRPPKTPLKRPAHKTSQQRRPPKQ